MPPVYKLVYLTLFGSTLVAVGLTPGMPQRFANSLFGAVTSVSSWLSPHSIPLRAKRQPVRSLPLAVLGLALLAAGIMQYR